MSRSGAKYGSRGEEEKRKTRGAAWSQSYLSFVLKALLQASSPLHVLNAIELLLSIVFEGLCIPNDLLRDSEWQEHLSLSPRVSSFVPFGSRSLLAERTTSVSRTVCLCGRFLNFRDRRERSCISARLPWPFLEKVWASASVASRRTDRIVQVRKVRYPYSDVEDVKRQMGDASWQEWRSTPLMLQRCTFRMVDWVLSVHPRGFGDESSFH
eukprot:scaffold8346_cov267-Pinguiococcus_pyrenoidosus.AAC.1